MPAPKMQSKVLPPSAVVAEPHLEDDDTTVVTRPWFLVDEDTDVELQVLTSATRPG